MKKKLVIAAGGTGGHLFPAQALAKSLECDCLFVAKGLKENKYFQKETFPFVDISSSALSKNPLQLLCAAFSLLKGTLQSIKALRSFRPDLVVGFGSYHTFPVLLAARLLRIPYVLHEQNSVLGRVNRLFARKALFTGVFFPEAKNGFKGTFKEVTLPLRKEFSALPTRSAALRFYGLDEKKKTILVFGGSQGALGINDLFVEALFLLPREEKEKIQILHFTGKAPTILESYKTQNIQACVKEFEPEMHYAWALADLLVSRSGANTVAEQLVCKVPAIFIPYPAAQDNHQEKNARFVQDVVQGAVCFVQKELTPEKLAQALCNETFGQMRKNIERYVEVTQVTDFCREITDCFEE